MKRYFLLLLLVLQQPARASQIVVGLQSENLVAWGVWEREGAALTHYLLLYNKSARTLDVKIKRYRYRSNNSPLGDIKPGKTFYHVELAVGQLVRLRYPKGGAKGNVSALLEYFENGSRIGVTELNSARPDDAARQSPAGRFYANEGVNGGRMAFWMAFESIYTKPTHITITAIGRFSRASEFLKQEYLLVKAYPDGKVAYPLMGKLDLLAAGPDTTIARLDSAHRTALVPIPAEFVPAGLTLLALCSEHVEDGYRYDERRQLVPDKRVGGSLQWVPVFGQLPGPTRRQ